MIRLRLLALLYVRRSELKEISPDRKSGESSNPTRAGSFSMLEAEVRAATPSVPERAPQPATANHLCRLDVCGKTEAAGQRRVVEEGDLLDPVAGQGEHHDAPGLRVQVVAEGRLAVGTGRT
jgi:hypothetical protein